MISSASPPSNMPAFHDRNTSPRTPPMFELDNSAQRAALWTSSDDLSLSAIPELSFDYQLDSAGNYVRVSKGSSRSPHSSPPTPQDLVDTKPPSPSGLHVAASVATAQPSHHAQPERQRSTYSTGVKPPSPISLDSPIARSSLSSSEKLRPDLVSAYSRLQRPQSLAVAETLNSARSLQRVASGPALVNPTSSSLRAPFSNGLHSTGRKLGPQRVALEEFKEMAEKNRQQEEELLRPRAERDARAQEEKENLMGADGVDVYPPPDVVPVQKRLSPRLANRSASVGQVEARATSNLPSRTYGGTSSSRAPLQAPGRQILPGPSRAGRVLMGSKYVAGGLSGFDKINEMEGSESESGANYGGDETDTGADEPPLHSAPSGSLRHRSYADIGYASALTLENGGSRPRRSASLSDASGATDDRFSPQNQLDPPISSSHYASRPGSSLGMNGAPVKRTTVDPDDAKPYLRRQTEENIDTEWNENHDPPLAQASRPRSQPRQSPSPTHMSHLRPTAHQRRDSDTLRSLGPNSIPVTASSPTAVEPLPTRVSPSSKNMPTSTSSAGPTLYHRRSPTAPEVPTTSGILAPASGKMKNGKTWAAGDEDNRVDSEPEVKAHRGAQPKQSMQSAPAPAAPSAVRSHNIYVNKKVYARLDLIGKGGSSRVYRVMNHANEIYAIKRVSLDKTDAETMSGYMNEIALLKRLEGNNRIIQLFDSEVKAGSGGTKGHLMLVMECGEVDLAKLLQEQQKQPMDMVWISYYWQQMLQAVHVIHEEKIVHSDLKPANFVLVRGQLKLIDFGIANAIANDTTNIQRDHQIGTVNYMSPEAIELPDGMRRLKVGRPSDVWSLGCILYQMVYGQPPFQHLSVYQKMKAIPDLTHNIDFQEYSTPSAVNKAGERKKLEHLQRRVRKDMITSMKSCLCRNPKERATIPELLEHDWLAMREPEPPAAKPKLASDETIINPYYMRQLLQYGIKLGQQSGTSEMSPEELLAEAQRLVAELKALEP